MFILGLFSKGSVDSFIEVLGIFGFLFFRIRSCKTGFIEEFERGGLGWVGAGFYFGRGFLEMFLVGLEFLIDVW